MGILLGIVGVAILAYVFRYWIAGFAWLLVVIAAVLAGAAALSHAFH